MGAYDESFKSHYTKKNLDRFSISPNRIVIEITERSMVTNTQVFLNAVAHYKSQGYQIAIDDVGACYSGLNVVCETHPHYLKIDMPLVRDIDSDQMKYALVKGLVEFAKNTSVRLLAKGIETDPELNMLLELGVDYGQGYLIGKPKPETHPASIEARRAIKTFYQQRDLSGNEWDRKVYRPVAFTFENCKSFNAYSDKYGDKKADEVLQLLYDTIRKMLRLSEQMFILDDMKCIAMIEIKRCQDVAGKICELFNQDVAYFYDSEDLSTGFIERLSKKGNLKRHPLLSVRSEEIY